MSELEELRKRYKKETESSSKMCEILPWGPPGKPLIHPGCSILTAALVTAKTTLPKGSPRRVFIQDLAAALDRRKLISKEKYDEFVEAGYNYMEA